MTGSDHVKWHFGQVSGPIYGVGYFRPEPDEMIGQDVFSFAPKIKDAFCGANFSQ